MKTVNISYLKNNLSAIIAKLQTYGSVYVVDRDEPIAVILPSSRCSSEKDENRLRALSRKGVLIHQTAPLNPELLEDYPPTLTQKIDAVQLLIEDRESAR